MLQENKYIESIDRNDYNGSLEKINKKLEQNNISKHEETLLLEAKAECMSGLELWKSQESLLLEVISRDEELVRAYYSLDYLYSKLEWYTDKDRDFIQDRIYLWENLENINSDKVDYNCLADAYKENGYYDKAIKYYKKRLKQDNNDFWELSDKTHASGSLASIYFEQEKYLEALNYYNEAIDFSIHEWGDERRCAKYYAVIREIYSKLEHGTKKLQEIEEDYKNAKKLRQSIFAKESTFLEENKEIYEDLKEGVQKERKEKKRTADELYEIMIECNYDPSNEFDVEKVVNMYMQENDYFNYYELTTELYIQKMDLILLIKNKAK